MTVDRVKKVVKVVGSWHSDPEFTGQRGDHGASELLGEIFGEAGTHARSAVGVPVLPLDSPVEVEIIVEYVYILRIMTTTPSQKLYTGVVPVVGEEQKPRIFTGRSSVPAARTEQIQRLYKIPEFMRTAAETWVSEGGEDAGGACSLRQAASVIFVRDGEDGLETILTYRPGSSPLGRCRFSGRYRDPRR